MSRKFERRLRRVHLQLFEDDWLFLEQVYGQSGPGRKGAGVAVRSAIAGWVKVLRARFDARLDARGDTISGEVEVEEVDPTMTPREMGL